MIKQVKGKNKIKELKVVLGIIISYRQESDYDYSSGVCFSVPEGETVKDVLAEEAKRYYEIDDYIQQLISRGELHSDAEEEIAELLEGSGYDNLFEHYCQEELHYEEVDLVDDDHLAEVKCKAPKWGPYCTFDESKKVVIDYFKISDEGVDEDGHFELEDINGDILKMRIWCPDFGDFPYCLLVDEIYTKKELDEQKKKEEFFEDFNKSGKKVFISCPDGDDCRVYPPLDSDFPNWTDIKLKLTEICEKHKGRWNYLRDYPYFWEIKKENIKKFQEDIKKEFKGSIFYK